MLGQILVLGGMHPTKEPILHSLTSISLSHLFLDEIIDIVRQAGIVGMGGAGFPTHVKLSGAVGKGGTCRPVTA